MNYSLMLGISHSITHHEIQVMYGDYGWKKKEPLNGLRDFIRCPNETKIYDLRGKE